tara:strand:+ start:93 stop:308 length:216 start_codon:yes stop_codon:yes gene_type:complete
MRELSEVEEKLLSEILEARRLSPHLVDKDEDPKDKLIRLLQSREEYEKNRVEDRNKIIAVLVVALIMVIFG